MRLRHQKCWYVYILSSLSGTLYVGLTDDLRHRMAQHKLGVFDGFTKKYEVNRLMYYEVFYDPVMADDREKQIKKYRRAKKIALFRPTNPEWKDLTHVTNPYS
jgi:putative endonuclease